MDVHFKDNYLQTSIELLLISFELLHIRCALLTPIRCVVRRIGKWLIRGNVCLAAYRLFRKLNIATMLRINKT